MIMVHWGSLFLQHQILMQDTNVVTEFDYLEDFKDGSEDTLRHLIERYKEALQQQAKEEYRRKMNH